MTNFPYDEAIVGTVARPRGVQKLYTKWDVYNRNTSVKRTNPARKDRQGVECPRNGQNAIRMRLQQEVKRMIFEKERKRRRIII